MSKSNDLLLCETIHNQLKKHERNEIISTIVGWLNILADGLDTDLSPQRALIISADILDVYAYDSLEDVREAIKKGRQGVYGWGMEKRGVINMMIINYWMSRHLEEKAIEREKEHQKNKDKSKKLIDDIDYEAYKKRISIEKKESETLTDKEKDYNSYKARYLSKK